MITDIAQGTPNWDVPVNDNFNDLQDQITTHETPDADPHGDRAYADSHFLGTTVTGTKATGRSLLYDGTNTAWSDSLMGPHVFNVKAYGAVGDGHVVLDGAITGGTATLTSATANFTMADVNKVIQVKGAGVSGVTTHVTTIQAFTNSTTVTLATNAVTTVTNAQVMWGTDDTAAIKAAVNAAVTWARANSGACTVFFPGSTGHYAVGGALVTGGTTKGNAQIPLPVIPVAEKKVILTFQMTGGAATQHWQQQEAQSSAALVSYGVFLSDVAQTASINAGGNPCVIGGPAQPQGYGTSALLYSNMRVVFRDMTILTTYSSHGLTYSGWDFSGCAGGDLLNFGYGTNGSVVQGDYSAPNGFSAGLSFGGLMPANGNNDDCVISNVVCHGGYTYGILATEHSTISRLVLLYCWSALCVSGVYNTSAGAGHAIYADQVSIESCTNNVYIFGAGAAGIGPFLDIVQLDTESGAPQFADNNSGTGLISSLGNVKITGLYTPANINTSGFPTGLNIIDGQNPLGVRSVSATASAKPADRIILGNTTSGGFTFTLPSAVANTTGLTFRNTGTANTLTIATVSSQTINGSATLALTTGQTARLISNGANWFSV